MSLSLHLFQVEEKNAFLRFSSLVTQAETDVLRIVVKFPRSGAKACGVMRNAQ